MPYTRQKHRALGVSVAQITPRLLLLLLLI
jgi:hypothetical protein